jgi:hypothetical protein
LKIINVGGDVASTKGGEVTLNVTRWCARLATSLGVQQQVAAAQSKLQGSAGTQARNTAQRAVRS